MKYVEKKITESAEYAYLICRYEENKNNLSSQNTNTQYCKTTYDNKMSDVAIEYFNDKYSTPKFYINSKLSDKSIHKTYRF